METETTSDDLFFFEWPRSVRGYEIACDETSIHVDALRSNPGDRALMTPTQEVRRVGKKVTTKQVSQGAFREVAGLPETPDGALKLVSRFGFLGSLVTWGKRPEDIASESVSELIEFVRSAKLLAAVIEQTDTVRAAQLWNDWRQQIYFAVRIDFQRDSHREIKRDPLRAIYQVVPVTLAAFIMLDAAREIVGEVRYKSCQGCGRRIRVGKYQARSHREFCQDCSSRKARRERERSKREPRYCIQCGALLPSDSRISRKYCRDTDCKEKYLKAQALKDK